MSKKLYVLSGILLLSLYGCSNNSEEVSFNVGGNDTSEVENESEKKVENEPLTTSKVESLEETNKDKLILSDYYVLTAPIKGYAEEFDSSKVKNGKTVNLKEDLKNLFKESSLSNSTFEYKNTFLTFRNLNSKGGEIYYYVFKKDNNYFLSSSEHTDLFFEVSPNANHVIDKLYDTSFDPI